MLTRQRPFLERSRRRYGSMFTIRAVGWGDVIVVSDPTLIKATFRADPTTLHTGSSSPLRKMLGPNSLLGIDEEQHLRQRKLLLPPFKGQRMKAYESVIAGIAAAEIDSWPEGEPFGTGGSMQRITLRAILRAIFGAEGTRLETLERLVPPWTDLGSQLTPASWLQRDLGQLSPWRRFQRLRAQIDAVLDDLIGSAKADPQLEARADVLSLMAQARYEDGAEMSPPGLWAWRTS